jgi:predicted CoA-substrate-specific enzyme activase
MSRFAVGIDLGTAYTKAIIIDSDGQPLARYMKKTGVQPDLAAQSCLETILDSAGVAHESLCAVVATGFARHLCSARTMAVTELTAAARGARFLFPAARMVLDIGGQTIKACRFDANGRISAFRLNDKCASGTGAFLERTARIMNQDLDAVDELLLSSGAPTQISSICAVFAESEIISLLVQAAAPEDIMHGAVKACVDRASQIAARVGLEEPKTSLSRAKSKVQQKERFNMEAELCLVGGVVRFKKTAEMLREKLACPVMVPAADMVQFVAALGAARLGIRFGRTIASI